MTLPLISNPVYVRTLLIKASKRTVRIHWEYAKHELLKSARVQICIRGLQDQTNTAQRHIMHRDCVDSVSARTKTESFAKESNTVPQTASKKHSADSASYREKPRFLKSNKFLGKERRSFGHVRSHCKHGCTCQCASTRSVSRASS